jgi:hypothetical protein
MGEILRAGAYALKGKDDLVSRVRAKYGLDKEQALGDVDALLKGRAF